MNKEKIRFLKRDWFWISLIAVAVCAAFIPAIMNQTTLMDDYFYILQAQRSPYGWRNLFEPVLGLRTPLVNLTLRIDWLLFGDKYFFIATHFENILFHAASSVVFYLLLRILRWKRANGLWLKLTPAWCGLTVLVFACHPQRVESVVWLAERKDVLAMFFGLSALFFFYRALKKGKVSIAAPVLLLISFSAKPMWLGFIVPAAMLLWVEERRFFVKKSVKILCPVLFATVLFLSLHVQLFSSALREVVSTQNLFWLCKAEIILYNYGLYFIKTFLPGTLFPIYPYYNPEFDSRWIALIPFILLLTPLLALKRELRQGVLFGWVPALAAFAAVLVPTVGFSQVGNTYFADRYSYLPALMLLIPLTFQIKKIPLHGAFGLWLPVLVILYTEALVYQTVKYLPAWSCSENYYKAVFNSKHPNSDSLIYFASTLVMEKKFKESESLLREKLKISLYDTAGTQKMAALYPLVQRGSILCMTGNQEKGIKYLNAYYDSPDWRFLSPCSGDLLEKIFSWGAEYYLEKKHDAKTAEKLYIRCADILRSRDIHYYYFYRGMAKSINADYKGALRFFEQALAAAPQVKSSKEKIEYCRKKIKENKR